MLVAVEALQLRHDHRGVGRYVRQLLVALPRQRDTVRFVLGVPRLDDVAPVRAQLSELPGVLARCEVEPIAVWAERRVAVAWYPWNFVRVQPASGAIVPTIHDLAPMLQLDGRWWKVLKRARARRAYLHSLSVADHVITGAAAARAELVARLGADASHITVVPHAADDFRTVRPELADPVLGTLGVSGPFLLAVGSQEPRKNLEVLFRAAEQLAGEGRDVPLVLCGSNARGVKRYGTRPPSWLRWAGFVSDDVLAALYRRATALVFASRYEGFGLPVLEAMTAGGVVVCAAASTLPEVGGDAALYFPPDAPAELARQVARLLDEPALAGEHRQRSLARARTFSWDASARGTLAAFDAAIEAAATRSGARERG